MVNRVGVVYHDPGAASRTERGRCRIALVRVSVDGELDRGLGDGMEPVGDGA